MTTREKLQEAFEKLYLPAPPRTYVPIKLHVSQGDYDRFVERWPHIKDQLVAVPRLPKVKVTKTVKLNNGSYHVTGELQDTYGTEFFDRIRDFSITGCADTVKP